MVILLDFMLQSHSLGAEKAGASEIGLSLAAMSIDGTSCVRE